MTESHDQLVSTLAEMLVEFVNSPPGGDDPVVTYADPPTIEAAFEPSVGLGFEPSAPVHDVDQLTAAAETVMQWSVHTSHPRFVNQNYAGPDPVSVVGDWMSAALNTTMSTFEVAPVFTLMERAVIDKLASLAGFPRTVDDSAPPPGMFCPGGATATLYALQLARHRRDPDSIRVGDRAGPHAIFVSDAGHYATKKAAALLGMGTESVFPVDSDEGGAMIPRALDHAIEAATAQGRTPLAVIATAGTTVTGAFDPIPAIAEAAKTHDIWLHVDGAYGGSALFSPRERHRLVGSDQADSFVWNMHKMAGMPQQCSVLLLRDPAQMEACFATGADYIFQPDKRHGALDSGDRTFQCGRRVDVLKLWLAWKAYGDDGFAARIDHAVAMADHARRRISDSGGVFTSVVAGDFSSVCLLWVPPEMRPLELDRLSSKSHARLHALAPQVKGRMQDEGTALIGYQPVKGINTFRLIFMNPAVTTDDVDEMLDIMRRYAEAEWPS